MKHAVGLLLAMALILTGCSAARPSLAPETPASPPPGLLQPQQEAASPSYVQQLAAGVVAQLEPSHGEGRIRAIYQWLVEQVWFADPVHLDAWYYLSDEDSIPYLENRALSPLLFRIGSCEDFAAAAVAMLRASGFEADYVAGYTLSVDQVYIDHAWAVVKLDGQWYHLDPQLEQNVVRGNRLTWRYYLKSDDAMSVDHRWGERLIAMWDDITPWEREAIRSDYTPPACSRDYPSPDPLSIPLPQRPNLADVQAAYDRIKAESHRPEPPALRLAVEPPVLTAAHHVTPPLASPLEHAAPGYGGQFLQGDELQLYQALVNAAGRMALDESIPVAASVGDNRARYIARTVHGDHPGFWWAAFDLQQQEDGRCLQIQSAHQMSLQEIEAAQLLIGQRTEAVLAGVGATQFEQALAIHDFLAGKVDYDREQRQHHSGSIYGALVLGAAYCDGYASAFHYLAGQAGLESVYIQGASTRGVPHAWNAVRLEGEWYYLDPTWDRPLGEYDGVYHDYFLITGDEMAQEHIWDATQYPSLPTTTDAHTGYYQRVGAAVGHSGTDYLTAYGQAFYNQLKGLEAYPAQWGPVFLEVKVLGEDNWEEWQEAFVRDVFQILREIDTRAQAEQLPVQISYDTSVRCEFNGTTRVITFYPKVKVLEA